MDFRIKWALQGAFSLIPGGRKLNSIVATYGTGTRKAPQWKFERYLLLADRHIREYESRVGHKPERIYEFGSGFDLKMAIMLGRKGCKVVTTDIYRNANDGLVDAMLKRLGETTLESVNVEYIAPIDTTNTGLPAGSFDLVTSTSVMEHIPPEVLPGVLAEGMRLLAPNGVCSFWVDYKDHWGYFDKSIPWCNFYRFGGLKWKMYNPPIQYQNRLRHSDYVKVITDLGFIIDVNEPVVDHVPQDMPIAPEMQHYSPEDLKICGAWFVLRKPA